MKKKLICILAVLLLVTSCGKVPKLKNGDEAVVTMKDGDISVEELYSEMKELFPDNRVEYFVSYYDYYQPEAYVPSTDTYIEKDSSINDEIDELRHSATSALISRDDVIVVASVSCIYNT